MSDPAGSLTEREGDSGEESSNGIPSAWLKLGASDLLSTDTLSNATAAVNTEHFISLDRSVPSGYDLLEEVGHGASGIVFRARQHNPSRTVALKMLVGQNLKDDTLTRFRQESDSLARLQHPGIVQVFEVGAANGQPYFSMEYCAGGNLAQRIDGTPLDTRAAAQIAAQMADATQAAHEAGIVHRDLKPGNVLISDFGFRISDFGAESTRVESSRSGNQSEIRNPKSEIIKISDFGLAKHLDAEHTKTRSGAILGTPSYMAPEQANETSTVTPAADIWSLGAVLYEMLTGRPPFKGTTILDTLDQVRNRAVVPPSSLNPKTPRDLETICLKCLEKEPPKRYASAAVLADDLRRWLDGRPIAARRAGPLERAVRWSRRRPAVAALSAFAVLALMALIAGGFFYSRRLGGAEGDKRVAEANTRAAHEIAQVARDSEAAHRYRSKIDAAHEVLEGRRLGWRSQATMLLEQAASIETSARDPVELRSGMAACLSGVDLCDPRPVCPTLIPGAIAFGRSGERPLIAVGQYRAILLMPLSIQVVDAADGNTVWNLRLYSRPVLNNFQPIPDGIQALAFSPDGRWLVAGTRAGNLYRWDLDNENPESISFASSHARGVTRIAFAADGQAVYSAGTDGKLFRWDRKDDWKQTRSFSSTVAVEDIALLSNGRVVASTGGNLVFLDPVTLANATDPVAMPRAGTFSVRSDGVCLALEMGRQVGIISLVDAPALIQSLRDPFGETLSEGPLGGVQFSPDGALLVTAAHSDDDRRVKIWDTANGRLAAALYIPGSGPIAPTFSPDGKLLAVIAGRRTLLYRVDRSDVVTASAKCVYRVRAFDWSPDGSELATVVASREGKGRFAIARLADGAVRMPLHFEPAPGNAIPNVAWSSSGWIAWNSEAARLNVVDDVDPPNSRIRDGGSPRVLAADPAGQLWGGQVGRLLHWSLTPKTADVPKPDLIWDNRLGDVFRGSSEIGGIAAGPSVTVVITRDGALYRVGSDRKRPEKLWITNYDPLQAVAMTRDESLVLVGSRGGKLHIHDLKSNTKLEELDAATDSVDAVDIAPDGKLFATGARDGVLKLWQWNGRPELLLTVSWPTPIRKLRFSPDGKNLGVLHSGETALRVWSIERLKRHLDEHGLGW